MHVFIYIGTQFLNIKAPSSLPSSLVSTRVLSISIKRFFFLFIRELSTRVLGKLLGKLLGALYLEIEYKYIYKKMHI